MFKTFHQRLCERSHSKCRSRLQAFGLNLGVHIETNPFLLPAWHSAHVAPNVDAVVNVDPSDVFQYACGCTCRMLHRRWSRLSPGRCLRVVCLASLLPLCCAVPGVATATTPREVAQSGIVRGAGDAKTVESLRSLFGESRAAGGRRRLLSPFEVHFSQAHIRPAFQDARPVEESALEARSANRRERFHKLPFGSCAWEALGVPCGEGHWWLLRPPFPDIEVIQWQCKLRDEAGVVRVDDCGAELHGDLEWYTLDNRRLYCLQRVAATLHPEDVRCAVVVVRQEEGSWREFRKFRTYDLGRSVAIGHREAPDLPRWSWRREVGLPEEAPASGVTVTRPRRRARGRPTEAARGIAADGTESRAGGWREVASHAMAFLVVYAALRLSFAVGRAVLGANGPAPGAPQIAPSGAPGPLVL